MLLVAFQSKFMPAEVTESVRIDPTRMAQGIMTGIGFLGGGVIVKEGITVRGLTTAASIWMTAAIGITIGVGFYWSAGMATVVAVGVLGVFRWLENVIPTQSYAHLEVVCEANEMGEDDLLALLKSHRVSRRTTGYRLESDERQQRWLHYHVTIRTRNRNDLAKLAHSLSTLESVHEFAIKPSGD